MTGGARDHGDIRWSDLLFLVWLQQTHYLQVLPFSFHGMKGRIIQGKFGLLVG
jgi:hypothetical protein